MDENHEYKGEERRSDYCPVHHIKCGEIKTLQADAKKRVPIWVFVVFISAAGGILGYNNLLLKEHIEKSNVILSSIEDGIGATQHGLNEAILNQKKVLKKLDLEFDQIPHY